MFEVTLKLASAKDAARVFKALADSLTDVPFAATIEEPVASKVANGLAAFVADGGTDEEDEAVRAAVRSKLIVRLTIGMSEVVTALAAEGGEADRGTLMAALPERSNNSIGRSLGALERAGLAQPRFEGSSHWRLSALARASLDGRIPMRVDKRPPERDRTGKLEDEGTPYAALGEAHVGSPEPAAG